MQLSSPEIKRISHITPSPRPTPPTEKKEKRKKRKKILIFQEGTF